MLSEPIRHTKKDFFWLGNEDEKISSGLGRGHEKQERRGSGDQKHKNAKEKPNDEVVMEILYRRKYVVEGYLCKVLK